MNADQINRLIRQCRQKDRKGQFELFQLFLPYLNGICRRYLFDHSTLEDVIQEIFMLVFGGIETSYDESKGGLKAWIRRIAINHCLKQNQRYRKVYGLDESKLRISVNPKVFYAFSNEALVYLLDKMPVYYREVFNLNVIDGYSHKEIGEMLNINEQVSRKRLSRAREWLKKTFKEEEKMDRKISGITKRNH